MTEIDYKWVKSQFSRARVRQLPGDTVLKLLAVWEEAGLPEELVNETLETFNALARGHALIPESEEVWVQAVAGGQLRVGHEVRIRHDAYEGDAGRLHNGRRGKVVAIRSGDVIFRSTDGVEPSLDGVHHGFQALERRVR